MLTVEQKTTAREFIDFLRPSNPYWLPEKLSSLTITSGNGWIYRGQADAEWKLLPSAFRGGALQQYSDHWDPQHTGTLRGSQHRETLYTQMYAEVLAVKNFIILADQLGIPVPLDNTIEKKLEKLFRKISKSREPFEKMLSIHLPPDNLKEAFALAQHHGIPTRLIDWTASPLVAAFFAAYEVFEGKINPEPREIAVWALNATKHNQERIKLFTVPHSRNAYLKAQSGMFSYDTKANEEFLSPARGEWTSQEVHLDVTKVTAPVECVQEILQLLYLEGISPAHLKLTLDNVKETCLYHQKLFNKIPDPAVNTWPMNH